MYTHILSIFSKHDGDGIDKIFSDVNVQTFERMADVFFETTTDGKIVDNLLTLCNKVNCKYKSEVCRLVRLNDNEYFLFLSLPSSFLTRHDVWSVVNVFRWNSYTAALDNPPQAAKPTLEKKILLRWLLPRLYQKSCEISIFPSEDSLRASKSPRMYNVSREIEFKLETLSQSLLNDTVVKVMVLRKVNRKLVNFKNYLLSLLDTFFNDNASYECVCVVELHLTDGVGRLGDVLPVGCREGEGHQVHVYSAFNPQQREVTCIVLHKISISSGNS